MWRLIGVLTAALMGMSSVSAKEIKKVEIGRDGQSMLGALDKPGLGCKAQFGGDVAVITFDDGSTELWLASNGAVARFDEPNSYCDFHGAMMRFSPQATDADGIRVRGENQRP